ncbi:2,3-bisphosphoglycerate-dependent phosphoglycerate mutase [Lacticaseibacillus sharpeae]|uniref:2,3-bisphosphoglycerate-dependent phosphoglycerate mutase n=1 Tax=Lacticaseibacillus sharpeae JCM 1186 = DSM 20505 TaxID=1291052 RepID=A0A0R1ZKM1_9LACO|nr:2,3-diphosphoglycerate-dependent phosphoglycerate mutase [Lacticaseibacillus sharpeae]KRM55511.1 Phosphoglycerate mutase 1 [Lacticaseibacillus sharpeae JCM 1186 = DSM 20505]
MAKLVLIRHGESTANYDNTYTGWSDVPLTGNGRVQATLAGERLAREHIAFSQVHTSMLRRAIMTAYIVQDAIDQAYVPITKSWRLNERHYGALRGLNKDVTRELFGPKQVAQWRRSYTAVPPRLAVPDLESKYRAWPASIVPAGESLADAQKRLLPYWADQIAPRLLRGENQLVVAHGSTLRALIKYLEQIADADIDGVEVGNAEPIVYDLDRHLHIISKNILHVN